MFWSNIDLPDPDGPTTICENGILGATSYLDCLNSYSFIFGVLLLEQRLKRYYELRSELGYS